MAEKTGPPQFRRVRPKVPPNALGINKFFPYKPFNRMNSIRDRECVMAAQSRTIRLLLGAGVSSIFLLSASTALVAAEQPKAWAEDWRITTQVPYGFTSGGAPGSFFFQSTPGTAFGATNGTHGFTDILVGRSLGFGRDLGLDNLQATVGARIAEPLITNGFTPAVPVFEDRRHVGTGPRLGLEGSKQLPSSWSVEWQVGAAMLFGDRNTDVNGAAASVLPSYTGASSSVLNVDGLLGLSYWFNAASKLTLGYRADYFKGASFSAGLPAAQSTDRLDHGPMVRFTIQK